MQRWDGSQGRFTSTGSICFCLGSLFIMYIVKTWAMQFCLLLMMRHFFSLSVSLVRDGRS